MAKNKKKMRKKLRNELIAKTYTQSEQNETSSTDKSVQSTFQVQPVKSVATSGSVAHLSFEHDNSLIKKEVLTILILFAIITASLIASKFYDNQSNWVITLANWIFAKI